MSEGGGFDPCECIWSHEGAMQRLLNVIRNSQTECTDNVCLNGQGGEQLPDPSGMGNMTLWLFLMGWIVAATALFILRPRSLRQQGDEKPARDSFDPVSTVGDLITN